MTDGQIQIPVGAGELIDKITILTIKSERIADPEKLANVRIELQALQRVADASLNDDVQLTRLTADLKAINESLWEIEDRIRVLEAEQNFGDEFVRLARNVYLTNDRRAAVKKQINQHCGSEIIEEKSFTTD